MAAQAVSESQRLPRDHHMKCPRKSGCLCERETKHEKILVSSGGGLREVHTGPSGRPQHGHCCRSSHGQLSRQQNISPEMGLSVRDVSKGEEVGNVRVGIEIFHGREK